MAGRVPALLSARLPARRLFGKQTRHEISECDEDEERERRDRFEKGERGGGGVNDECGQIPGPARAEPLHELTVILPIRADG